MVCSSLSHMYSMTKEAILKVSLNGNFDEKVT